MLVVAVVQFMCQVAVMADLVVAVMQHSEHQAQHKTVAPIQEVEVAEHSTAQHHLVDQVWL
jgi:hypothetical protein